MLDFILRKTYGFNKKEDCISLSQFYLGTGLGKTHVIRALHYLEDINIIHITKKGNGNTNMYKFNKDFTTWKPITKKGNVTNNGNDVINNGNKSLPKKGHTKVDITKVDITKEKTIFFTEEHFKELWEKYPSKVGRKKALSCFFSTVKTDKNWQDINRALDNYLASDRVKNKFIQDGKTWFNNWVDFIDYKDIKPLTQEEKELEEARRI